MKVKAVIFDLVKTLGEFPIHISDEQVSDILVNNGYLVYPQAWRHAFSFVVFIDYPKHGYNTYHALIRQALHRLDTDIDQETLNQVAALFINSPFTLYTEAVEAVNLAKKKTLKTAICTSTPKHFFIEEITPIQDKIDYICTGYEAGSEKSNPHIYQTILNKLQTRPQDTIVIGDSPKLDIQNPKKLGLKTIQITNKPNTQADHTAKNVYEAVQLLK